jgi:tetratricopeptide (TPR) repeat protein
LNQTAQWGLFVFNAKVLTITELQIMKNFIIGLGVILSVIAFVACEGGGAGPVDPIDNTGKIDSTAPLNSDATIQSINEDIKREPNNANHYYRRAKYLIDGENFTVDKQNVSLAINDMKRALSIDSAVAVFHYEIGSIYYLIAKPDEAKFYFEKCIALDPEYVDAHIKLAQIYFVFKAYDKAMKQINTALRVDDFVPEAYYLKGWIYKETGDTALAVSSFQTARELDDDYYDAHMQLGILYASANSDEAIEYYNAALHSQPESLEALYALGLYCQEHNYIDTAFECYRKILEIEPAYGVAHYNQGYIYLNYRVDYDSAVHYFTKAIEVFPDYSEAFYNRGLANESLNRWDEAEADYRQSLALKPDFNLPALGLSRLGQ